MKPNHSLRSVRLSQAALALALACGPASAGAPADPLRDFRDGAQPGCAIGIFSDSEARFAAAGFADLAAKEAITPATRFRIASASKQFTALAIAILVDQGRLDPDARADSLLPEMAGALQGATVRQLMNQTAGVRDHTILIALQGVEKLGSVDAAATLAMMARQRGGNFPPGSQARYSNGNYLMLAEIVARVSGESLPAFAEAAIFAPLGMKATGFLRDAGVAHGYQPDEASGGYRVADDQPATAGSGGVVTSVEDLARYHADFRAGHRVWTDGVRSLLLTPGRLLDGTEAILPELDAAYGGGLALLPVGDDVMIWHDGGLEGFRADYVRYARSARGAAVLCNRVDADAHALALEALGQDDPQAGDAGKPVPGKADPPAASPAQIAAFAGRWRSEELDTVYEIAPGEEGLNVTIISPLNAGPVAETWGGLRVQEDGVISSGPLRLSLAGGRLSLGFGHRVAGVTLERIGR